MEDRVEITEHVSIDEFKRRIDQTDIALNIRERTVGETSASPVRLIGRGCLQHSFRSSVVRMSSQTIP